MPNEACFAAGPFFGLRFRPEIVLALPAVALAIVAMIGIAYLLAAVVLLIKEANFFIDCTNFLFAVASGFMLGVQAPSTSISYYSKIGADIKEKGDLYAGLGAGFAVGNAMAGAMSDAMKRSSEGGTSTSGGASAAPTRCIKCGAELAAGSKFCRECGVSQAPAKCSNCQHELKPGAKFCDECGTKVG